MSDSRPGIALPVRSSESPVTTEKAPPRLYHIASWESEMSYCGAKSIAGHEHEIHTKELCKAEHQICVVCVAMHETNHGRPW